MTEELRLKGLGRHRVERVSGALFALGALGLQEDWLPGEAPAPMQPWDVGPPPREPDRVVLVAWFEDPDRAVIERTLRPLAGPVLAAWAPVPETDWEESWKATFPPIVVSERLTVAPPWDAPPGALVIDPGQGFGTGQHTTTRQALVALDALLADPELRFATALDVGCGSGILALAAARAGLAAEGVDVEEAAVREAAANAARNGLSARFSTESVGTLSAAADLVLANLHAELVVALGSDLARLTRDRLVVAGILADREGLVHGALGGAFALERRVEEDGWVCQVWRRTP